MEHYLSLFVRAVFIENMALAFFLGMHIFSGFKENFCGLWFGCSGCRGAHDHRSC